MVIPPVGSEKYKEEVKKWAMKIVSGWTGELRVPEPILDVVMRFATEREATTLFDEDDFWKREMELKMSPAAAAANTGGGGAAAADTGGGGLGPLPIGQGPPLGGGGAAAGGGGLGPLPIGQGPPLGGGGGGGVGPAIVIEVPAEGTDDSVVVRGGGGQAWMRMTVVGGTPEEALIRTRREGARKDAWGGRPPRSPRRR